MSQGARSPGPARVATAPHPLLMHRWAPLLPSIPSFLQEPRLAPSRSACRSLRGRPDGSQEPPFRPHPARPSAAFDTPGFPLILEAPPACGLFLSSPPPPPADSPPPVLSPKLNVSEGCVPSLRLFFLVSPLGHLTDACGLGSSFCADNFLSSLSN